MAHWISWGITVYNIPLSLKIDIVIENRADSDKMIASGFSLSKYFVEYVTYVNMGVYEGHFRVRDQYQLVQA